MNPDTGRFEEVPESELQKAIKKDWKFYNKGGIVEFNDWAFEIISIDTVMQRIVLKPLTPERRAAHHLSAGMN